MRGRSVWGRGCGAVGNGWTPLMLASGGGWRHGVWDRREPTLQRDLEFQEEHADEERTLDTLQLVLDGRGNVSAVDETGSTALH